MFARRRGLCYNSGERNDSGGDLAMIETRDGLFCLHTDTTTLLMRTTPFGHLELVHYGPRVNGADADALAVKSSSAYGCSVNYSEMDPFYTPGYGDIVVISQPNDMDENLIKRVIATEGQQVDINFSTGAVYIDGHEIVEKYISTPTTNYYDVNFPVTVPEGCCFVMGDNRQNSVDSRSTIVGFIDNRYVIGNAFVSVSGDGFKDLSVG